MSLEEKIFKHSNGCSLENLSVGSLLYLISLPKDYNCELELNDKDLKELGKLVVKHQERDFQTVICFTSQLLKSKYNIKLPEMFGKDYIKINNQKGLKKVLANEIKNVSKLNLSEKAIKNILEAKNNKNCIEKVFEMYFIDVKQIKKYNDNNNIKYNDKINQLKNIRIRKKSLESLVYKFLIRLRKIVEPTEDEIKEIDQYNSGLITKEQLKNDFQRVINISISFCHNDFYESLYRGDFKNIMNTLYKEGSFISRVQDIFLIDAAGSTISGSKNEIKNLKNYIWANYYNKNIQYNVLPSRSKDYFKKDKKDRSIVFGIKGNFCSSYCEIRLVPDIIDIKGIFGNEYSHDRYKLIVNGEFRKFYENSEVLQKAAERLCTALDLDIDDVLNYSIKCN